MSRFYSLKNTECISARVTWILVLVGFLASVTCTTLSAEPKLALKRVKRHISNEVVTPLRQNEFVFFASLGYLSGAWKKNEQTVQFTEQKTEDDQWEVKPGIDWMVPITDSVNVDLRQCGRLMRTPWKLRFDRMVVARLKELTAANADLHSSIFFYCEINKDCAVRVLRIGADEHDYLIKRLNKTPANTSDEVVLKYKNIFRVLDNDTFNRGDDRALFGSRIDAASGFINEIIQKRGSWHFEDWKKVSDQPFEEDGKLTFDRGMANGNMTASISVKNIATGTVVTEYELFQRRPGDFVNIVTSRTYYGRNGKFIKTEKPENEEEK